MSSVRELTSASPGFEAAVEPEPATSKPTGLKAALPENSVMRHEPAAPWQYAPGTWGEEVLVPFQTLRPGVTLSPEERLSSQLELVKQITSQEGPAEGAAYLEQFANQMLDDGQTDAAKMLYRMMKEAPFNASPRDLLPSKGNSNTTYNIEKFMVTAGAVANIKLAQVEMSGRIERSLGQPVGLDNVAGARAYFDQFAQSHDVKQLGEEFQRYLEASFVHSGGGVQWPGDESDPRSRNLQPLLDGQPIDGAGRRVIDCEGFAYLAHSILGGIESEDGSARFSMNYATRPGHIIAVIGDPSTGDMLLVNNEKVTSKRVRNSEEVYLAVGSNLIPELEKNTSTAFGYAARQERARFLDPLYEWVPGAVGYNGTHAKLLDEADARAFNKEFHDWQHKGLK